MLPNLNEGAIVDQRYRITGVLGSGGMGTVYLADEFALGRQVAIKIIHLSRLAYDDSVTRLMREGRVLGDLKHPNIVAVLRVGTIEQQFPFLVMEYVRGQSLAQKLLAGPLSWPEALPLVIQVAEALQAAHASEIIHRDIKPENLMLVNEEGVAQIKLLDFGLCRCLQDSQKITDTGSLIGSLHYMAPEIVRAESVTTACDIYSLGCVLFKMVTGELAISGDHDLTVVYQHISKEAPRLSELIPQYNWPAELESLVSQCLAKKAAERPTAQMVATQCRDILKSMPAAAVVPAARVTSTSGRSLQRKNWRRVPIRVWIAATALTLGAVLSAVVYDQNLLQGVANYLSDRGLVAASIHIRQLMANTCPSGNGDRLFDIYSGLALEASRAKDLDQAAAYRSYACQIVCRQLGDKQRFIDNPLSLTERVLTSKLNLIKELIAIPAPIGASMDRLSDALAALAKESYEFACNQRDKRNKTYYLKLSADSKKLRLAIQEKHEPIRYFDTGWDYLLLAEIYREAGDETATMRAFGLSREYAVKTGDWSLVATAVGHQAGALAKFGRFDEANTLLERYLRSDKMRDCSICQARLLQGAANVALSHKEYEKAIDLFSKALILHRDQIPPHLPEVAETETGLKDSKDQLASSRQLTEEKSR